MMKFHEGGFSYQNPLAMGSTLVSRDDNEWLWSELQQARNKAQNQEGSSSQGQEERIHQVEQAWNETLVEA